MLPKCYRVCQMGPKSKHALLDEVQGTGMLIMPIPVGGRYVDLQPLDGPDSLGLR